MDSWVKQPAERSIASAELFGGFAYGITVPREEIPASFKAQGKDIDLSSSLYLKLIDLMAVMPIGIGDFLLHPSGQDEKPSKIVEALQVLVACGIASPMRGVHGPVKHASVAQPRFGWQL